MYGIEFKLRKHVRLSGYGHLREITLSARIQGPGRMSARSVKNLESRFVIKPAKRLKMVRIPAHVSVLRLPEQNLERPRCCKMLLKFSIKATKISTKKPLCFHRAAL